MDGTTHFKEPIACTPEQRREFARLVRQGFEGSDEGLHGRIQDANRLAFRYAVDDTLAAIAALKAPDERYRREVFKKANLLVNPADYELELGWVYVVPAQRRNRVAESLCRQLLACLPALGVFAKTRINNVVMIKILGVLGFERVGRPYRRHDQELVIFLRS